MSWACFGVCHEREALHPRFRLTREELETKAPARAMAPLSVTLLSECSGGGEVSLGTTRAGESYVVTLTAEVYVCHGVVGGQDFSQCTGSHIANVVVWGTTTWR